MGTITTIEIQYHENGIFRQEVKRTSHLQRCKRYGSAVEILGDDFEIVFSKTTGTLQSWIYKGHDLLLTGPKPNFWRTPTDNDFGNRMPERMAVWKQATDGAHPKNIKVDFYKTGVGIEVFYDFPAIESNGSILYVCLLYTSDAADE